MLNFLWCTVLFFLLIDAFIMAVGGGLWVFNVWFNEMFGIDLAKRILKKLNEREHKHE